MKIEGAGIGFLLLVCLPMLAPAYGAGQGGDDLEPRLIWRA